MGEKRTNKLYPAEFKEDAVTLIRDQGDSVSLSHFEPMVRKMFSRRAFDPEIVID